MISEEEKDRIRSIVSNVSPELAKNYKRVETFIDKPFNLPEIDPIRYEICYCLLFSLNQASITLTNHLLEKYLKIALVYREVETIGHLTLDESSSIFEETIKKYNKNLDTTINLCCSKGIITKEEKKILNQVREKFRNAFSHADSEKTFGDLTIPVTQGSLSKPTEFSTKVFFVKNYPMAQGIVQKQMADLVAFDYFVFADKLIRNSIVKIFPDLYSHN